MVEPGRPEIADQSSLTDRLEDSACGRFEADWLRGRRPRIEDYLAGANPADRPELLRELVRLELELRRRAGETPEASDYLSRFSDDDGSIRALLDWGSTGGSDPLSTTRGVGGRGSSTGDLGRETPGEIRLAVGADLDVPDGFPKPGRLLGDYRLEDRLGGGGMGVVYRAWHLRLGRTVALKLIHPRLLGSEAAASRFRREIRAVGQLDHPNLVRALDARREAGHFLLAMELLEGLDLGVLVRRLGPLTPVDACGLILQAAEALAYVHGRGLIHRDVKPTNLMLTRGGTVKLLDLGLARSRLPEPTDLTPTTGPIGTFGYMAPEQAADPRGATAPADLYSLGCTLHYLLRGRPPVTFAALDGTSEPERLPAELLGLIGRLLAFDPSARPGSAVALIEELRPWGVGADLLGLLERATSPPYAAARAPEPIPPSSTSEPGPAHESGPSSSAPVAGPPPDGGLAPGDPSYLERPADDAFAAAIGRRDSIILLRGARQAGKTSLLARAIDRARRAGARVVFTDLQRLNRSELGSPTAFYRALGERIARDLGLGVRPRDVWDEDLAPNANFEEYLQAQVLDGPAPPLLWALDEVDRLFACDFGGEVFALIRSWHNDRAINPAGPWSRLSLGLAYATEAHLFIADVNQSPFNVGTLIALDDFGPGQVAELNRRRGGPLRGGGEVARYHRLVGGHPFLTNRGLYEMAHRGLGIAAFEVQAVGDDGIFGDHLRGILATLTRDAALLEAVRAVLRGRPCPTPRDFYRLRAAGIVVGRPAGGAVLRGRLYETYLRRHLA